MAGGGGARRVLIYALCSAYYLCMRRYLKPGKVAACGCEDFFLLFTDLQWLNQDISGHGDLFLLFTGFQ